MNCPNCGKEMKEEVKRIKYKPVFGTSKTSLATKSKVKRTFWCENCKKRFAYLMQIVEVELA